MLAQPLFCRHQLLSDLLDVGFDFGVRALQFLFQFAIFNFELPQLFVLSRISLQIADLVIYVLYLLIVVADLLLLTGNGLLHLVKLYLHQLLMMLNLFLNLCMRFPLVEQYLCMREPSQIQQLLLENKHCDLWVERVLHKFHFEECSRQP